MFKHKELVHKSLIAEVVEVPQIKAVVIEHINVYLTSLSSRRLIYIFQCARLLSALFVNWLLKLVSDACLLMQLSLARHFAFRQYDTQQNKLKTLKLEVGDFV
jgi:hypothetical protein